MKLEVDHQNNDSIKPNTAIIDFSALEDMDDMMFDGLEDDGDLPPNGQQSISPDLKEKLKTAPKSLAVNSKVSLSIGFDKDSIPNAERMSIDEMSEYSLQRTKSERVKSNAINTLATKVNDRSSNDFIQKLLSENKNLIDELQLFKDMIAQRDSIVAQRGNSLNPMDMSDNKVQFTFLFASPLVRENNGAINSIMQLDCLTEIEDIVDSLQSLDYNMKYKI